MFTYFCAIKVAHLLVEYATHPIAPLARRLTSLLGGTGISQSTALRLWSGSAVQSRHCKNEVVAGVEPASSSPLQGASAFAHADRYAGGQHAVGVPCYTFARHPVRHTLGCVRLPFPG